jgi:hypothetical protein
VTRIEENTFHNCSSLTSVVIPESVASIGYYAFDGCSSLTSVTIPEGVTSIGVNTFAYCSGLLSVVIPESVKSIGNYAFYRCSSLTSVTIPYSVTGIGNYAFSYCSSLADVTVNWTETPPAITGNVFYDLTLPNITLHVPAGTKAIYEAANVWKDFGTITEYVPVAIDAPASANAVRVYPDPATESFRIDGLSVPTQVTVTDVSGKTVLQQNVKGDESISVGHLPQGVYLVRVNERTVKVIKSF